MVTRVAHNHKTVNACPCSTQGPATKTYTNLYLQKVRYRVDSDCVIDMF